MSTHKGKEAVKSYENATEETSRLGPKEESRKRGGKIPYRYVTRAWRGAYYKVVWLKIISELHRRTPHQT